MLGFKSPQDVNFWNGKLIHRMTQAFHLLYFGPSLSYFFRGPPFFLDFFFLQSEQSRLRNPHAPVSVLKKESWLINGLV